LRVPAPVAAGLPSDLLRHRPDVLAAEQALVAANARIGFVKASRFPTFSLTAALGTESPDLESLFGPRNSTSALGLGMQLPLFDAGRAGPGSLPRRRSPSGRRPGRSFRAPGGPT
jgi:multidrug efflux system outer membrane protein